MTYTPDPFPTNKTLTMAGLQSWTRQQLDKIALAVPNALVLDAALFDLPIGKGTDAVPAWEAMIKKVPDGAVLVFTQPGTLDFKQDFELATARRFITFASLRSARAGSDDTRTTWRWSPSTSGGRAFFLRSAHQCGFVNIAFRGSSEDILLEFDDNGVSGISGSRCFLRGCQLLAEPRAGHRLWYISRNARANQEWHRAEDCDFGTTADGLYIGGRYDVSNAGNLVAGSDRFSINGAMYGEGHPPTWFTSAMLNYSVIAAVGPDGRKQFRTTIAEILSPTLVRLADPAPLDGPNCYFAVTKVKNYAISIGASANSLKHRFHKCSFTNLYTGVECVNGSFHTSECIYTANVRNLTCVGSMEPCCDETPTCESSLQHLFVWSDNGFQIKGPGRLAISTPMPAAPFISFGEGAMSIEIDHTNFQDRGPLPLGSPIFDPTIAYDAMNDHRNQPPLLQLLLRQNRYWYKRADIGLYRSITGPQQIWRQMESDADGLVFDQKISAAGVQGA